MTLTIGLDLSLTSTGIAFVYDSGQVVAERCKTETKHGSDTSRRRMIADSVQSAMSAKPDIVVIESVPPAHGRSTAIPVSLAYIHGAVLDRLLGYSVPVWWVAPKLLKQHATGDGTADKAAMIAAAQVVGYEGKNADEADAVHLGVFGLHLLGALEPSPHQVSCLQNAVCVLEGATA